MAESTPTNGAALAMRVGYVEQNALREFARLDKELQDHHDRLVRIEAAITRLTIAVILGSVLGGAVGSSAMPVLLKMLVP